MCILFGIMRFPLTGIFGSLANVYLNPGFLQLKVNYREKGLLWDKGN